MTGVRDDGAGLAANGGYPANRHRPKRVSTAVLYITKNNYQRLNAESAQKTVYFLKVRAVVSGGSLGLWMVTA